MEIEIAPQCPIPSLITQEAAVPTARTEVYLVVHVRMLQAQAVGALRAVCVGL